MKPVTLAFAGRIKSGKSTISQAVSTKLGWKRASFGDYVRKQAALRGIDQSRESLQGLGAKLVDEGWEKFCLQVLKQADWKKGDSITVDGVRHMQALETLRKITLPAETLLVFVKTDERTWRERLNKEGIGTENLKSFESHSTEKEVAALSRVADFVVEGGQSPGQTVDSIIKWIGKIT